MRKLSTHKRTAILTALVEGNSIASTCRMTGASKVTVLRLLADVGTLCASYHDLMVRGLRTRRIQVDELWAFVGAKQKQVNMGANGIGDVWTWTAIDADSKLMVSYLVGFRDAGYATEFVGDIKSRLDHKIQLTSDGLKLYVDAVEDVFGGNIDYAQLIKVYGKPLQDGGQTRYSPPDVVGTCKEAQCGRPDPKHVSTSYVERQNLTVRMSIRRFTRLTNAFSKKLENHEHAVAFHYFHYNFCRKHQSVGVTPAVAAGIANRRWTIGDLVDMLEREERANGGRLTSYLPAASKNRFSK